MAQPAAAAPQPIPGTLDKVQRVFAFMDTGWVMLPGLAASVPGVLTGMPAISLSQGKIILRFNLSLGGVAIPARVEIGPTASSLIVDPAFRLQLSYEVPYWDTLMRLFSGKDVPINGTAYNMTLPMLTGSSPVVPDVEFLKNPKTIKLAFSAPYPKVGSGMLWAYVRAITVDEVGCTLDLYRPLLGFDLAKNPRFSWSK